MGGRYFLGIDIGTSESKGVIIGEDASVAAYLAVPHALETPLPGYAEHDAEKTWWADFCALSRGLLASSGIGARDIAAVGCSTIAPCCLPVDGACRPLRKAILYGVDVRAAEEIRYIEESLGADRILETCGTPVSSQSAAAKILWIKNHEPDVYEKAARFVTGATFLAARLTGNYVIDRYTAAAWAPLYDVEKQDWNADLSGMFCPAERLAACRWTCDIAGTVTAAAAGETGLAEGTPVTVGTADAAAEAVSAGVFEPGDLELMYGSSLFFIHVVDRFARDRRLCAGPYLFHGTYAVTAGMSTTGTLTRWFRDNFARDLLDAERAGGEAAYAALMREAGGIPAGSCGLVVLPYMSGERTPVNDPKARGVLFGLNLLHTRAHVYNACLEGVGYGIAQHMDIFGEMGLETRRIMAVGGGTKNGKWLRIVSDILGKSQRTVEVPIGAAYGDALLAALGTGFFQSRDEIAGKIKAGREIPPDMKNHEAYKPYRELYRALYDATKDLMHKLG